MLPYILSGIALVLLLFILFVIMRPDEFRVSRTGSIAAPPAAVFDYLNNMHKFQEWSPWAKLDPNCRVTFSGPDDGKDASFHWSGNRNVGEGRMTITDSRPAEFVQSRLEFIKPFACTNTVEWTLQPDGIESSLTWNMRGRNTFLSKLFGIFVNCEKMVGGQFEQGFRNLNALVGKAGA